MNIYRNQIIALFKLLQVLKDYFVKDYILVPNIDL